MMFIEELEKLKGEVTKLIQTQRKCKDDKLCVEGLKHLRSHITTLLRLHRHSLSFDGFSLAAKNAAKHRDEQWDFTAKLAKQVLSIP